jgi:hypothetical protein
VENPKSFSAPGCYVTLLRKLVNDRLLKIHCPIKVTAKFQEFVGIKSDKFLRQNRPAGKGEER